MRPCSEAGEPPLASREDLQPWKWAPGHERGLIIRWILLIILFDGPFFFFFNDSQVSVGVSALLKLQAASYPPPIILHLPIPTPCPAPQVLGPGAS